MADKPCVPQLQGYTALRYQYRQTRVLGTTVFIPEIADFIEVALTSCPLNCSYFLVNGHLIERPLSLVVAISSFFYELLLYYILFKGFVMKTKNIYKKNPEGPITMFLSFGRNEIFAPFGFWVNLTPLCTSAIAKVLLSII